MSISLKYKPRVSRTKEAVDAKRTLIGQIVRKTAFDVEADYKRNARRDTGAQTASAYTTTNKDSNYGEAVADARAANPDVGILAPVSSPSDELRALVAVAVDYAIWNEIGARGKAGDGAMTRAVETNRTSFKTALRKAVDAK